MQQNQWPNIIIREREERRKMGTGGEERSGIMRIEDGGNGKLHDILTEE